MFAMESPLLYLSSGNSVFGPPGRLRISSSTPRVVARSEHISDHDIRASNQRKSIDHLTRELLMFDICSGRSGNLGDANKSPLGSVDIRLPATWRSTTSDTDNFMKEDSIANGSIPKHGLELRWIKLSPR